MTIRLRLTIWYGATFMLLIAIVGLAVWWQLEASLRASTEDALRLHASDVAADLREGVQGIPGPEPSLPGVFTIVVDPATGIIDSSPGAPADLPVLPLGASIRPESDGNPAYAFFAMPVPDGRMLIAGRSLTSVDQSAALLAESMVIVGTAGALGSLLGGWWLAGRALAPIRQLTSEADAIGPHELQRRLPVPPQQDEVGHLAATLNRLLTRVEESVGHERVFIAGAAHDLRTPIAALRMRLDVLLRSGYIEEETRVPLEDARADATDLGELADALLGLAEAQAKGLDDALDDYVLPMLVSQAEQEVEWVARERAVRIEQTVDETSVRISGIRFRQALTNLLSNAVRHGPVGSMVTLSVRVDRVPSHAGAVVLTEVSDEGPGIDPAVRESLFVPFAMRRGGATTHGLGLATAAAAVESQGGEIGYRDRGMGSVFWFWLPIAGQEEAARGSERPRDDGRES